ncbi:MAG: hypothetical protein LBU97_02405 [Alistipes sp.]|nr:hypothetical protein [Alistipes sp.]
MEDVDTQQLSEHDEEMMFLSEVIQDEYELLFLDSYLLESFKGRTVTAGDGRERIGSGTFNEEISI